MLLADVIHARDTVRMDIETLIVSFSYLGIFFLMIANGFISFPSSQILYIIVGYFIGTGYLALLPASFLGALGNTIGNIMLYETVRRYGIGALKKFQIYREEEIRKVEVVFRRRGAWFLFIGKLLPAIKVFVPIPAGLGKMRRDLFTVIMFVTSWLWSFVFIAIGYFFGRSTQVFKTYAFVLLLVAFVIVYLFYRYLNSPEVLRAVEGEEDASPLETEG